MTSKIVGLRGQEIADPRVPDRNVIAVAEDLLERARSGEINGIVAVMQYYDTATGMQRAGTVSWSMVGRLEQAKAGLVESLSA